jgi:hypothetical protein
MRLYKIEITSVPKESLIFIDHGDGDDSYIADEDWVPEGWPEHTAAMAFEGHAWAQGSPAFFWPSEDKHYRSRSAAAGKVTIVERWGGEAILLEAEVSGFVPVEVANRRRKDARDAKRAEKLRAVADQIMAARAASDDLQGRP